MTDLGEAMKIYAIIPARSGSKGLPDKNIRLLHGKPLMAYSIDFAKTLPVDRIFCSTDSERYAEIAKSHGAEVPFLRAESASSSTAMEQDILPDLYQQWEEHSIPQPDLLVWLRPTFVFRQQEDVVRCLDLLRQNPMLTAARTVCEAEGRLYRLEDTQLLPDFNDFGKSMIRRQDFGDRYKVFSTDVFRSDKKNTGDDFLGRQVAGVVTNKLCGLDIDDLFDFQVVENIVKHNPDLVHAYIDGAYIYS